MPWKTITRKELYDEVWSQAVSKLAPKYNLSDVGFTKLCKRCDIPTPPRGYWAKLEAGKKVKKTPLPKHEEESEIRVYVPEPGEVMATEKCKSEAEEASAALPPIEIGDNLRGCHRLVSETRQAYERAKQTSNGILEVPSGAKLDLYVSHDQLHRSLLILDALLKAFESLANRVSEGPAVKAFGQSVSFSIKESVSTIEEELESNTKSLEGRYDFFTERKRKKQVPSGTLSLLIHDAEGYWASGCRKQWKDAKVQRLENCLNSIVTGVLAVAAKKRDHELEMKQREIAEEEARKKRAEEAQQRAERRKLQKAEQSKLDQLLEQVASWRKSKDIRDFVDYVRAIHQASGTDISPDSQLGQWLAFASQQADRLDPTVDSPKTILDEVIPDEPSYPSYRSW